MERQIFQTHKEPLNPSSTTLEKASKQLQNKIQAQEHLRCGTDELIDFKCDYSKCKPPIDLNSVRDDTSLYSIYKSKFYFPIISVYWEINSTFMVPCARTIAPIENRASHLNEKPKLSLLPHAQSKEQSKCIQDCARLCWSSCNTSLKNLLHEVIKNEQLCILAAPVNNQDRQGAAFYKEIKEKLCFDEENRAKLVLNYSILPIINQVKQSYHLYIHKHMGYPLQLHHICALILHSELGEQMQDQHHKWPFFEAHLQEAINILYRHERREEDDMELYYNSNRKKRVREIINKIKLGYFPYYINASDSFQINTTEQEYILHFHPSMRRASNIASCNPTWLFPDKYRHEILFERTDKKQQVFDAKVENEDEFIQMILLTPTTYGQFIQPIEWISNILDYPTDFNLIYLASKMFDGNTNRAISVLSRFETWKKKDVNKEKYEQQMNEFVKRRCCNHEVNLFYMFLFEQGYLKEQTALQASILSTVIDGLPFVNQDKDKLFETLLPLPSPLYRGQCISFNHEILVCGGYHNQKCYSYHTIKRKYKRICLYPSNVELNGHCVIKLMDNNNSHGITLLSFGGSPKHTLMMKYVSVWDNDVIDVKNESHLNKWIPFTDNNNNPILIGRDEDNYCGARALISGSDNNLLFITYHPKNISVFDLHTFQYIKHSTLPVDSDTQIKYHCFVLKPTHGLSKEKKDKKLHEMMLFCKNTGLTIEYDEDYNLFQFYCVWVCTTIRPFYSYGFVCVNDTIWFFGGSSEDRVISKAVYGYSMLKDQWMKFEQTLSMPLTGCVAILSGDNKYVHIIGGYNESGTLSTHIKTKVKKWTTEKTAIQRRWIEKEEEKRYIEKNEKKKRD
ncbi:hypothetical protein RFI_30192 [Reticulomyxa filosa]|uniref:Kelch motif family protein n=1 Tax=Reticulomyxa filosa TaxID=46433 RepID=X6LZ33_RETFI|nr:hypothetical protein RFI_30192 [Reticulomyxa filosa]|eukprot:ETO07198.1 hypothetical protein RFI_30192 [Reticulomyxa filosa]